MVEKIIATIVAATLSSASLFAQAAGNQAQAAAQESAPAADSAGSLSFLSELDAQAEAVSDAKSAANDYLIKKGWVEGLNKDGRYVAIGNSAIEVSPADKDFQIYRVNAYKKAMIEAKSAITRFFAQEISARSKYAALEPQSAKAITAEAEAKASIPPTILDKAKTLVNKKLDDALKKSGVNITDKKAKPIIEDVLNESVFSDSVEALAKTQVGALITSKIFEQDKKITVVCYYSENTKLLAGAINGTGYAPKVTPRKGDPVGIWIKKLKISQLYPSIGVQMTSDEDGNIVIISYGQAKARSKSATSIDMAYEKATLEADGFIRNFAGETVAYAGTKNGLETGKETEAMTAKSVEETMSKMIETEAGALSIPGISTIRSWEITDPRSGSIICGVVRMWSIKTSDTANTSRESMRDATLNRGGNTAVRRGGDNSAAQRSANNADSGKGRSVEAQKYKIQSIESEDF